MVQVPPTTRRRLGGLVAVLTLGLLAGACSDDSPTGTAHAHAQRAEVGDDAAPATALDVVAGEYAFGLSATTVAAGRLPLELRNEGAEPHQLMVARLHDGVTVDDYLAAFEASEAEASALIDEAGGVNAVDPGATRTGFADLEPGSHVVLCYLPSPGGPSHLHEGMVAELTVVEAPVLDAPEAVNEISLVDFGFALPDEGLAEPGTYQVINNGQSDHELVIMRVNDGRTLADVAAYLQGGFRGERPLSFVGGAGGVEPGADTFTDVDLEPGQYVAMCFLPDAATGKRHVELGMVSMFTVP